MYNLEIGEPTAGTYTNIDSWVSESLVFLITEATGSTMKVTVNNPVDFDTLTSLGETALQAVFDTGLIIDSTASVRSWDDVSEVYYEYKVHASFYAKEE